ncbi:small ribosomal subunit Rsm22 family protein [Pseudobdellovibrio exovorus]|uniref:Methyltransferase n=1 Tax=Pseudobdellovibrio exovorus JSS TaxID=1184267 RepID=M4V682_9BACT|nr:small ribosomal subunit Rsm22 family protein [Pseudobdellovibrio exovorus]AGH94882.1 hypothetical protein A11Q_662 [Pseudobdellovibrio exovorus JSS]
MFLEAPTEKLQFVADCVLRLSDYYISRPDAETPWNEKFCQVAYRHYFLPLNFIRNQKVIQRGLDVGFFNGLTNFIDWGCGPATASLALAHTEGLNSQIRQQILFDHSPTVLRVFSDLHEKLTKPQPLTQINLNTTAHSASSCLVFSYSLTELDELPTGWNQHEALMILEPSTTQDGRRLMEWRKQLLKNGYHIWAPCTHHDDCPLLIHSQNDWCHDRAHVDPPEWFLQLEQLLPMKNRTVTVSYILARKTPPAAELKSKARLTGDSLEQKGKTRQLVCRNSQREFLTWMHRTLTPQTLSRGELVDLPEDLEIKSNELRLKAALSI